MFYGYATGVYSCRKIVQATYDSVAFHFISVNTHPDHDALATFRKRFLNQLQSLFVQILVLAREMGIMKLGKVSLDGTKVKANASKHHTFRGTPVSLKNNYRLRSRNSCDLPKRLILRGPLMAWISQKNYFVVKIGLLLLPKPKKRLSNVQLYDMHRNNKGTKKKWPHVKQKQRRLVKKPRGPKPKLPKSGPRKKDQVNLTDRNPESLGKVDSILADTGYFSDSNESSCEQAKIEPFIPPGREKHNQSLAERSAKQESLPENADSICKMRYKLRTDEGRKLYAKRKNTVEPVFSIIKHVMGFRQFLLRGFESVIGEWTLVSMAWNLKRMFSLKVYLCQRSVQINRFGFLKAKKHAQHCKSSNLL